MDLKYYILISFLKSIHNVVICILNESLINKLYEYEAIFEQLFSEKKLFVFPIRPNSKPTKLTKSYKMVPILKYIKPFLKNDPKNDPKNNSKYDEN